MIRSFADKRTEDIYNEEKPQGFPSDVLKRALAKLQLVHYATNINDLQVPAGNLLEKLKGDRNGQWSIRINRQWRICFDWREDDNAYNVEITDYH